MPVILARGAWIATERVRSLELRDGRALQTLAVFPDDQHMVAGLNLPDRATFPPRTLG